MWFLVFLVTQIFAHVPCQNCRSDFDAVWFTGCQSQVIAFLQG